MAYSTLRCADDTAPPAFVAAHLLSQAEHGEDSAAILLTTSEKLAHDVAAEVERQMPLLPTAARACAALERYGMISRNTLAALIHHPKCVLG